MVSLRALMRRNCLSEKYSRATAMRVVYVVGILLLLLTACSSAGSTSDGARTVASPPDVQSAGEHDDWRISVVGPNGEEAWSFTEKELVEAFAREATKQLGTPGEFTHTYSAVNNWPTVRYYVANGYSVASILSAAGLNDVAQKIAFRGHDGYEISVTREQLMAPQFYYPRAYESEEGAERVYPIIAYRWRDGTRDLSAIRDDNPCFILGQRNTFEHTNPAFVQNVSAILVSAEQSAAWSPASTFPLPGPIASGEKVKLQHPDFGLVKLHYSLDGSDPDMHSPMYNPSTYQPELNAHISITEPTVIKVVVCGFGRPDSEIATFEFLPQE